MDILLLKLGDIQGEVTIEGYAGQIEVLSFSHAISQAILHDLSGLRRAAGRPQHQEFTITKYFDRASITILDSCDRGTSIPQATLTIAQIEAGAVRPLEVITLKNVIISSVAVAGGSGARPAETVTLNYTGIAWLYNVQDVGSGQPATVSASWNLSTNTEDK